KLRPHPEEHREAMRLEGWNESVRGSILRDGRASKSAVADFDTLSLPKSGKPDFDARPPQDEVPLGIVGNLTHSHQVSVRPADWQIYSAPPLNNHTPILGLILTSPPFWRFYLIRGE